MRTINGQAIRDAIDLRFLETESRLEVELQPAPGGPSVFYEIHKPADALLGIVPAPGKVRRCANHCLFCYVDGNPPGVRESLLVKDDDYRLSFIHGSYITLTNIGPRGFARLMQQRLSPLYVSVHATEPEVRQRLLGVPRGGDILHQLAQLVEAGIRVHTQVVICPGLNDGEHLERTLLDLWSLGEGIVSVSLVPVGLTRYNTGRQLRPLEPAETVQALELAADYQGRSREKRGYGWAYGADELFLLAGAAIPPAGYYDELDLMENGVGGVRGFLDAVSVAPGTLPRLEGRTIGVVTGTRMGSILKPELPLVEDATRAHLELIAVNNDMFGPLVTAAGLLPGKDILGALRRKGRFDAVLLPAQAINGDGLFVDDLALHQLKADIAPTEVVAGHDLADAMASL